MGGRGKEQNRDARGGTGGGDDPAGGAGGAPVQIVIYKKTIETAHPQISYQPREWIWALDAGVAKFASV